jgi:prepilin-type N-terminal cleavage/methylation domain-containing protein
MKQNKLQDSSLRRRHGFTLIELIVVIAILAILAAIAVPTFVGTMDKAKKNTHNANVMSLRSAAAIALAENGNPSENVTWKSTGSTGDARFNVSKYIDTWPTYPLGTGDYTVTISTGGVIAVTPDKVPVS